MKKKYVKPKFTFISNLSRLESIRQWDKPNSTENSNHIVEVAYIDCEQGKYCSTNHRQNK